MITVALAALATAPRRALVLALLGTLPVAVAAAAPAYVYAAERAVIESRTLAKRFAAVLARRPPSSG